MFLFNVIEENTTNMHCCVLDFGVYNNKKLVNKLVFASNWQVYFKQK